MASLTITIPNDKVDRVLTAFEYTPDKGSKTEFMKKEILDIIKSKVGMYETQKLQEQIVQPTVDISNLNLS